MSRARTSPRSYILPGDVIAFRHADRRFPFLWENSSQPPARWNAEGELTHYLCDTPDGAWAEFLRHEEIDDPQDLLTIRRAMWAVDIGEAPTAGPGGPDEILCGNPETWPACQELAQQFRGGTDGITAPSAALEPGGATGWRVDGGLQPGPIRDGKVFVLFGLRPDLVGWAATIDGRPGEEMLGRVRHF